MKDKGLHCIPRSHIDVEDVYEKMCIYADKPQVDKREWLQTVFNSGSGSFSSGVPHCHKLCNSCFMKYHGIPRTTFFRLKKASKLGDLRIRHGNTAKRRLRRSTMTAMAWLEEYAKASGDVMPESGDIHLPDARWKHVWTKMSAALKSHGDIPPTTGQFIKAAKKHLPGVKIVKVKRFARCTICDKLDTLIGKSSGEIRDFYVKEKDSHIRWQQRERNKYYKHREKARSFRSKHKCLSIAIDSMDHTKTSIPKRPRDDKDAEHCNKLITHITGVLIHGRNPGAIAYTWYDRFPAGSDVVSTILLDAISRIEGPLPPTLYLQLDNCWRENKNKYILGLSSLLVEEGIFRKVKISFLPKGHTHDDPDQMFSCFHRAYLAHALFGLDDLVEHGKNSFHPTPTFVHLDNMGAWSALMKPHFRTIEGVSKPRVFRIKRDEEGKVRIHYRMQMQTQTAVPNTRTRRWLLDMSGDGAGHDTCRAIHLIASAGDTVNDLIAMISEKTSGEGFDHELYSNNQRLLGSVRVGDIHPGEGSDAMGLMVYPLKEDPLEATWMPKNGPGFEIFKENSRPDIDKLVNMPFL